MERRWLRRRRLQLHPHAARPLTRGGCWAALAAFEVSGATAGWPTRVTCAQAGVSPTAGGCVGSGGGSGARRCGLPRPLPPPPPASARLIILLIDKQSGRGGDSRRASVAKQWETRRAPPGNSARALGPGLCRRQGPRVGLQAAAWFAARAAGRERGRRRCCASAAAPAAPQWSRDGGGRSSSPGVTAAAAATLATALAPSPFFIPLPLRARARHVRGPWGGV